MAPRSPMMVDASRHPHPRAHDRDDQQAGAHLATSHQMMHEIGREPMPKELEKLAVPLEKVRKVLKIAKEPISLEMPVGDEEEDSYLGDFIEDKNTVLPLDAAIQANLRETTPRVPANLTPREERVLRMRFSIGMNTDHTLAEVGQQFSVPAGACGKSRPRRCAS
jgi:RNA polymerase primary sigma factor